MLELNRVRILLALLAGLALNLVGSPVKAANPWVVYDGGNGPGKGKSIVFVTGDEEYRSEEGLPQLAKILAKHHGFKCTVLFSIDPKTGTISPNETHNIPGLEALKTADLLVIQTRFRDLPDDQMKYIVDYVESGKPVVGLRTATHAFSLHSKTYQKYSWNHKDEGYDGGFGRQVLGETWIAHWGTNHKESTRGVIAKGEKDNPILRGIKDGEIWATTGSYQVRIPMQKDCTVLVYGQVLAGMHPEDKPLAGKKNDPLMPLAWTKTSTRVKGKTSRAFATTMGSSTDLENEAIRRLLVNACYWAMGMEDKIPAKSDVDIVGKYKPSEYGFNGYKKGVKPADLQEK